MKNNLRVIEINTTAFEEENIILMTDLTDAEIKEVITPIVFKEREEDEFYDNDMLCDALRESYPNNIIVDYATDTINRIII